jgi:hypothetical protein
MRGTPLSTLILVCFLFTSVIGPLPTARADGSTSQFHLPAPGVMVHLSPEFNPPILKGLKVHPDNPFRFDFILDKGDSNQNNNQLREESSKLIKYFLASLTIPEKDLWVNLSPYEKNRIIPDTFGITEMGRDLLAEDYMLKQITASLIYPEDEVGKKFWKRIYEEAQAKYHTTNIPINTFNKVWIVPEKAVVYENAKAGTAYVVTAKLKVMLEEDYLSFSRHSEPAVVQAGEESVGANRSLGVKNAPRDDAQQIGTEVVRQIVIPELTKEINEGKNFAQLRQIYSSLILATWYKKKIKDSVLSQVYADKNKVRGVNLDDPKEKEIIYQQYLQAFKKGVYNYIKEEPDPITNQPVPRRYFSGGLELNPSVAMVTQEFPKSFFTRPMVKGLLFLSVGINAYLSPPVKAAEPVHATAQATTQAAPQTKLDLPGMLKQYEEAIDKNDVDGIRKLIVTAKEMTRLDQTQFFLKLSIIGHKGIALDALKALLDTVKADKTVLTDEVKKKLQDNKEIWQSHGVGTCVRMIDEIIRVGSGVVDKEADLKDSLVKIGDTLKTAEARNLDADLINKKLWEAEDLFVRLRKLGPLTDKIKNFVDDLNAILITKEYYVYQWGGFNFDKSDKLFVLYHIDKTIKVKTDQGEFPIYLLDQKTHMFNDSVVATNGWSYPSKGFGVINKGGIEISDANDIAPVIEGKKPFINLEDTGLIEIYKNLVLKAFKGKAQDERVVIIQRSIIAHESDHLRHSKILKSFNVDGEAAHSGAEETFVLLETLANPQTEPFSELARLLNSSELPQIKDALLTLAETDDPVKMREWLKSMTADKVTADQVREAAKKAAGKYEPIWRSKQNVPANTPATTYKLQFDSAMKSMLLSLGIYNSFSSQRIFYDEDQNVGQGLALKMGRIRSHKTGASEEPEDVFRILSSIGQEEYRKSLLTKSKKLWTPQRQVLMEEVIKTIRSKEKLDKSDLSISFNEKSGEYIVTKLASESTPESISVLVVLGRNLNVSGAYQPGAVSRLQDVIVLDTATDELKATMLEEIQHFVDIVQDQTNELLNEIKGHARAAETDIDKQCLIALTKIAELKDEYVHFNPGDYEGSMGIADIKSSIKDDLKDLLVEAAGHLNLANYGLSRYVDDGVLLLMEQWQRLRDSYVVARMEAKRANGSDQAMKGLDIPQSKPMKIGDSPEALEAFRLFGGALDEKNKAIVRLMESVGIAKDQKVLSIGPGYDVPPLLYAALKGARVDINQPEYYVGPISGIPQEHLNKLRRMLDNILSKGQLEPIRERINIKYPYPIQRANIPSSQYDRVILVGVMDGVDQQEASEIAQKAIEVVKNGGIIIFGVVTKERFKDYLKLIQDYISKSGGFSEQINTDSFNTITTLRVYKTDQAMDSIANKTEYYHGTTLANAFAMVLGSNPFYGWIIDKPEVAKKYADKPRTDNLGLTRTGSSLGDLRSYISKQIDEKNFLTYKSELLKGYVVKFELDNEQFSRSFVEDGVGWVGGNKLPIGKLMGESGKKDILEKLERFVSIVLDGDRNLDQEQKNQIMKDVLSRASVKLGLESPVGQNSGTGQKGGIDFAKKTPLEVQNAGEGIKFQMDPAMLQQLQNAPGFVPVIISIQPMTDLKEFLGLNSGALTTQLASV